MKKQYNILDLFVIFNPKLFDKGSFEENEAKVVVFGFNADYGNLKIDFKPFSKEYVVGGGTGFNIVKAKSKKTFALNSEHAMEILNTNGPVNIIGRTLTDDWVPPETCVTHTLIEDKSSFKLESDGMFIELTGWRAKAFDGCLEFLLNGKAWQTALSVG